MCHLEGCEVPSVCWCVQNGSVDGALSSRPPMSGRPPVLLDWRTRVATALTAALGLADLQRAALDGVAVPITPSRMMLSASTAPHLQPPSFAELTSGPAVGHRPFSTHF